MMVSVPIHLGFSVFGCPFTPASAILDAGEMGESAGDGVPFCKEGGGDSLREWVGCSVVCQQTVGQDSLSCEQMVAREHMFLGFSSQPGARDLQPKVSILFLVMQW